MVTIRWSLLEFAGVIAWSSRVCRSLLEVGWCLLAWPHRTWRPAAGARNATGRLRRGRWTVSRPATPTDSACCFQLSTSDRVADSVGFGDDPIDSAEVDAVGLVAGVVWNRPPFFGAHGFASLTTPATTPHGRCRGGRLSSHALQRVRDGRCVQRVSAWVWRAVTLSGSSPGAAESNNAWRPLQRAPGRQGAAPTAARMASSWLTGPSALCVSVSVSHLRGL